MAVLCEVGPRDGLQNAERVLPTTVRAELVDRLSRTGLSTIESVSFVDPARVPQMADAERVVELVPQRAGVTYAGLVLNTHGYDRLATTSLDEAHLVVAATESFSERNANASRAKALAFVTDVLEAARHDGRTVIVTIAVAFGCPFEGRVDPGVVVSLASRLADAGTQAICLADTIGVAAPREVSALVDSVTDLGVQVGLHLHNTRNTGYANAVAGLEAGANQLDCAVGGLGGCPFAPGATGNVATEDLVYLLERDGIDTGIDLDQLINTSRWLEELVGKPLPGYLHQVGPAPLGREPNLDP